MHRALQRIHDLRVEGKSQRAIAQILEAEGVPFPPGRYKKWNHGTVGRLLRQLESAQEEARRLIEAGQERARQEKREPERERQAERGRERDAGWKAELQLLELQHERHALEHQRLQLELERLLDRLERRAESPSGILPQLLSAALALIAGGVIVMVITMLYQPPFSPSESPPPLPFTAPPPLPPPPPLPRPPWEKAHEQAPALTGR